MTVNLSALAGAGQQFLDNNGNVLTGGKLYTYAAGTTTPQTTYTSSAGGTALSNPIILDSAGRVPTGEIWLTMGSSYKFVLKTSTDVLLATWDNITGTSSNSASIVYIPAGASAVTTTVQAKLRERISVFDFGATGDGVTDDTAAIQAALTYAINVDKEVFMPGGTYKTSATLTVTLGVCLIGEGRGNTLIYYSGASSAILASNWQGTISDLAIFVSAATANGIEIGNVSRFPTLRNVYVDGTAIDDLGLVSSGSGFYLNAGTGFSSAAALENCYSLQFKFGLNIFGTNSSNNCWTGITINNCWFLGNSEVGKLVSGSCGIFMSPNSNGGTTVMTNGIIQSMEYGCYFSDGSEGAQVSAHFESNTYNYFLGNTFNGNVINDSSTKVWQNAIGSTLTYRRSEGDRVVEETRYPQIAAVNDEGVPGSIDWYRGNNVVSATDGVVTLPTAANALKFAVGIGRDSTYGISVFPSEHYIQLANKTIHWDTASPAAQTGSQIVYWTQGSICYNSTATVGQPIGWMCTVSGAKTTGTVNSGSTALTVVGTAVLNGQAIRVVGAGAAGADLTTTVASGGGTVNIVLTAPAGTSVVGAAVYTPGTWVAMANL